jgi:DNA-binding NtrC family response regulator
MSKADILIVEDERNLAYTLAQALRRTSGEEFTVVICSSAGEALLLLSVQPFDLVISDLRLPGMSGLELLSKVRQDYPDIRTILMTGFGTEQVEAAAKQLTDAYLTKPFDLPDVLHLVQQVIKNPALPPEETTQPQGARRILVMEDEDDLRRLFSRVLSHTGYEVYQAATLQEARDLLNKYRFDVFLCDIYVGSDHGTDLLRERSADLTKQGTQVIMVSGESRFREECEQMGAEFFLTKPVALNSLVTLVTRIAPQR